MAKALLQSIDQWLDERDIAFAMLFGEPRVYASSGYVPVRNELRTADLLSRRWNPLCGRAMVKVLPQSAMPWPSGVIDLRGPAF
jgi:hypothetical protein